MAAARGPQGGLALLHAAMCCMLVVAVCPGPVAAGEAPVPSDEEERAAQTALERTLIERGGLLVPPWALELQPGLTYFLIDIEQAGAAGPGAMLQRVHREVVVPALTLRLGLPWRLQVEGRIPWRYEREREIVAGGQEQTTERFGLSDVQTALSAQLLRERSWMPDLLFNTRYKSTTGVGPFETTPGELATGTGFHAVQAGLTAVRSRDPVVFFADASYTTNISRDTRFGRIDPGDTLGFELGLVLAVNPVTSLNASFEQRFTRHTTIDRVHVAGSSENIPILRLGASYVLARNVSVDFSVGIGLSQDTPDMEVTFVLPIRLAR